MKKKIAIITALLFTLATTAVNADARKNVIVDGQPVLFDQSPIVTNGVTLVQFTPVFNQLGITSSWNQQKKQVTAVKNGTKVILTVGNKNAYVNGNLVKLEVAPAVIGGKVFVPLRFISESTGAKLSVRNNGNTIEVISGNSANHVVSHVSPPSNTQKPESKPNPSQTKPTNQQIQSYLDQNYSRLSANGSSYDVSYTAINKDTLAVAIHIDLQQFGTMLDATEGDFSHLYKLTKPVAQAIQSKFNINDIGMIVYLDFDSPIYSDAFGADHVHALSNGYYNILAPVFYASFDYDQGVASTYIVDSEDKENLSPMYNTSIYLP